MLRLLVFLVVLALAAIGLEWLADNPGLVTVSWRGVEYESSLMVGLGAVLGVAIVLGVVWSFLRFVLKLPSIIVLASRMRRREKGFAALSKGLVAVGAGDSRKAQRYAIEARKLVGQEPLAKLLRAQAAQLSGDRSAARAAFNDMLDHDETHALGLRGLHVEATRAGQADTALEYAKQAAEVAALPWAAQAVLDDRARRGDWSGALDAVESNAAARLIDKPTANRWRAVLRTALAQELADRDAKAALTLAQEALYLAPGLVPAAALAARLLAGNGDYRKASKLVESAYAQTPHPDLATAYLKIRHGDSAQDKLIRARALARLAPFDPESAFLIARAALDAQDYAAAHEALAPLFNVEADGPRPTVRACLLAAELAEAENDALVAREWLNRAARAPRDRAWVAEGVVSDHWAPVSPAGTLDAFVWRTPDELLTAVEPPPAPAVTAAPPALEAAAPASAEAPTAAPPPVKAPPASTSPAKSVLPPSAAPDDPGPPKPADASKPYWAKPSA